MIKRPIELVERLNKIKKCNLCSQNTSMQDARNFCIEMVKLITECEVPAEVGAPIFKDYLQDCFTGYNQVPSHFLKYKDKSVGYVIDKPSLDYAIGLIDNLAEGDTFAYDLVVEQFAHYSEPWLKAQEEFLKQIEAEVQKLKEEREQEQLNVQQQPDEVKPEQVQSQQKNQKFELVNGIMSDEVLMHALYAIKKVDLTNENTSPEDVMRFCKEFMAVVANCKLPTEVAAPIFKNYLLNNCYSTINDIPEKFFPNKNERLVDISRFQTADYALTMIDSLAKGTQQDCAFALEQNRNLTSEWIRKNQVDTHLFIDKPSQDQIITQQNQLIDRLYSIDKVNVCDESNSVEDVKKFCNQFMQVVVDCKLPANQGAEIFKSYLTDCFDDFSSIPQKFAPNQDKTLGDLREMNTQDFAISVIGNMSTGSQTAYKFATTNLTYDAKLWLQIQNKKQEELAM